MRIGPSVDVWPGALEHFYLVQIPIHGAVQIGLGNERVLCAGTTAAVISPGEDLRLRWSDNCAQLIVQIPRETIEARLAERFGCRPQHPLKFQTAFDLENPAGRDWRALLNFTVRSVDKGGLFSRDPLLRRSRGSSACRHCWRRSRITTTANCTTATAPFPITWCARNVKCASTWPCGSSVARLAAGAGVSERTLHDGFRRFRATTPMGRLTALRLAAARRRLLDGGARNHRRPRCGRRSDFFSSADLPGAYRNAFGELPSATLRAARQPQVLMLAPPPAR